MSIKYYSDVIHSQTQHQHFSTKKTGKKKKKKKKKKLKWENKKKWEKPPETKDNPWLRIFWWKSFLLMF